MVYQNSFLARYVMNKEIEEWLVTKSIPSKSKGKSVGGSSMLMEVLPHVKWEVTGLKIYKEVKDLEWYIHKIIPPENLELGKRPVDVLRLPWEDDSIDIIIADQLLGCVPYPWIAAEEMIRVTKPGGIVIATASFMSKYNVSNYFNISIQGLEVLFYKLNETFVNSWGNKEANNILNYTRDANASIVEENENFKKLVTINDKNSPFTTWMYGVK